MPDPNKMPDSSKTQNIRDLFVNSNIKPKADATVTELTSKAPEANIISAAESKEQKINRDEAAAIPVDPNYIFTVERAAHKVTITPTIGQVYNYLAQCVCNWQGRFLTNDEAEIKAKQHVGIIKRRGM